MMQSRRPWPAVVLAVVSLAAAAAPAVAADAPGAPGDVATWTEGDKDGIGAATSPVLVTVPSSMLKSSWI